MNRELKLFMRALKHNGFSATKPRIALFKTLQSHNALTIQDLVDSLSNYDQSTIYRSIDLFEKMGIVTRIRLGQVSRLELSDVFHHHHHHFSCLKCKKVYILPEDLVLEQEIARLSFKRKFKAIDHQLEIRGFCRDCKN